MGGQELYSYANIKFLFLHWFAWYCTIIQFSWPVFFLTSNLELSLHQTRSFMILRLNLRQKNRWLGINLQKHFLLGLMVQLWTGYKWCFFFGYNYGFLPVITCRINDIMDRDSNFFSTSTTCVAIFSFLVKRCSIGCMHAMVSSNSLYSQNKQRKARAYKNERETDM